ncbi:hypothetical protein BS78_06G022300 [Paspalum vaginatum]|nr:hypothetical protein BS78_06G022300 [Paspalum vaginatum]KAJ1270017.1 hypothetical protein BS78_06G022300 [Paspalum vaginatum]
MCSCFSKFQRMAHVSLNTTKEDDADFCQMHGSVNYISSTIVPAAFYASLMQDGDQSLMNRLYEDVASSVL